MADRGGYQQGSRSEEIQLHTAYITTREGIFKIVEIVLSIITFICSIAGWWPGHGWVEFVSSSAFITTTIYLIFNMLRLYSRFPGPWLLIEFFYYLVFAVFYLISAIVATAKAVEYSLSNVSACAFFAFAATFVYAVDTFFMFRTWRQGQVTHTSTSTGSPIVIEQGRTQY